MKWRMEKFCVLTILFLAYAMYNTFHGFGLVAVLGYIVLLVILIVLYREVLQDGWHWLKKYLS